MMLKRFSCHQSFFFYRKIFLSFSRDTLHKLPEFIKWIYDEGTSSFVTVCLTSLVFLVFVLLTEIVRPSVRRLWKSSWVEWGKPQSTVQKSQIFKGAGATPGGLRGRCQMLSSSASGRLQHPLSSVYLGFIYFQLVCVIEGDCVFGSRVLHFASCSVL